MSAAAAAAVEALNRVAALETAFSEVVTEAQAAVAAQTAPPPPLALPAPSKPAQDLGAAMAAAQQQQQTTLLAGIGLLVGLVLLRGWR